MTSSVETVVGGGESQPQGGMRRCKANIWPNVAENCM